MKGEKGDKGDAGVGIANVSITEAGNLKVTLTNNTSIDLGNIKGADGIGITKSIIDAQGHLVLTYSDGNTSDLGVVVGQDGARGADGKDGADGVGISDVAVSTDGVLVITLSNGEVKTLGNIKGEKGEKGDKGDTGRGIDHMDIVNGELWVYYTDGTNQNLGSTGGSSEGSVLIFVELPDGTYGVKAGEKAKDVAVIEIPETYNGKAVTQIIANGFEKLTTLQQITFPNCLKKIGSYAFRGCTSLAEITIPESVTCIEQYAFYGAGLTKVTMSFTNRWNITGKIYGSIKNLTYYSTASCSSPGYTTSNAKLYLYESGNDRYDAFELSGTRLATLFVGDTVKYNNLTSNQKVEYTLSNGHTAIWTRQ